MGVKKKTLVSVRANRLLNTVHVELLGLEADRWYWYRFKAGGEISPAGRTRTMPAIKSEPDRLRFDRVERRHPHEFRE